VRNLQKYSYSSHYKEGRRKNINHGKNDFSAKKSRVQSYHFLVVRISLTGFLFKNGSQIK
jgi:hypothetical protein